MTRYDVRAEYFDWLTNIVCEGRFAEHVSFRKLLAYLHDIEFIYFIPKDKNRAADGESLRHRFAHANSGIESMLLRGPCSVLEMMVALALRCEEDIMDDARMGDRTGQWFWEMITSLGLGGMTDERFDDRIVADIIDRFLYREYEPNGRGGLFTVRNRHVDMRKKEIWAQLCCYLDTIG